MDPANAKVPFAAVDWTYDQSLWYHMPQIAFPIGIHLSVSWHNVEKRSLFTPFPFNFGYILHLTSTNILASRWHIIQLFDFLNDKLMVNGQSRIFLLDLNVFREFSQYIHWKYSVNMWKYLSRGHWRWISCTFLPESGNTELVQFIRIFF